MALRTRVRPDNTWPGFVDALSTLLLAIIFLLVVFVLSHFMLSQALTGRDEELTRLNRQITELSELLALEQQASSETRETVVQLSASLQESTRARDLLTLRIDDLSLEIERITNRADQAEAELLAARQNIEADREKIELQVHELVSLRRDIEALRQVRANLEQQVADYAAAVTERDRQIGALRDRAKELEARIASEEERTLLAQKEIESREVRIEELIAQVNLTQEDAESAIKAADTARKAAESARQEVISEQFISARAQNRVNLLNQQIAALRQQLLRLEAALEASEAKDKEQKTTISDLGRRLNVALARRVEELSKYRSEFFGRLREVLGDRADITIVGDRFVFQSEVLFETGSAELGSEGKVQLAQFAQTLKEISAKIPKELPWVIRVDGHTDVRPIATPQFPSNWELSAARAIAVTRFIMDQGISPERLAAAGFAEYQPLDPREDEIAYRRNRRIELKLTER